MLQRKLEQHFRRIDGKKSEPLVLPVPHTTHMYNLNDGFAREDLYWIAEGQLDRFEGAFTRGILYRPEIVVELESQVEKAFAMPFRRGVMVKGPEGIGKSHSLVNLVRKLLYDSNGTYLVTFIQDCENFVNVLQLYDSICQSFGTSTEELDLQATSSATEEQGHFSSFVAAIDLFLKSKNKKWVLIFDQINRLFARPSLRESKDLGVLPFPFNVIKRIMKPGRITSIVSASANNKISYRNNHPGFKDYNHCLYMTDKEVEIAFEIDARNEKVQLLEKVMDK